MAHCSLLCFSDLAAAIVIAHGPDCARLPLDPFEREEKAAALLTLAQRLAVDEQLHSLSRRYNVDVLPGPRLIVPVTNDVRTLPFHIHPTIPHHPVGEVTVLR